MNQPAEEVAPAKPRPETSPAQRLAIYYWLLLERLSDQHTKDVQQFLSHLQADWEQIAQGQRWAAQHIHTNAIARILASSYPRMLDPATQFRLAPVEARLWYLAALQAAEKMEDKRLRAIHLNDLGETEFAIGNYREANHYLGSALEIAVETGNLSEQSRAIKGIGQIYASRNDFDHAASLYRKALELVEQAEFPTLQASILNQMGMLFVEHERYEDAIALIEESTRLNQTFGDAYLQLSDQASLGIAYVYMGQYEEGVEILQKLLPYVESMNNLIEQGHILGGLAVGYRHLGRTEEGINLLRRSIEIAKKQDDSLSIGKRLVNLALLYAQKDDVVATLNYLQQARGIFTELNLSDFIQQVDDYLKRVNEPIQAVNLQ